ncbi:unnamed protein product, partial [Urochloa humidicola]
HPSLPSLLHPGRRSPTPLPFPSCRPSSLRLHRPFPPPSARLLLRRRCPLRGIQIRRGCAARSGSYGGATRAPRIERVARPAFALGLVQVQGGAAAAAVSGSGSDARTRWWAGAQPDAGKAWRGSLPSRRPPRWRALLAARGVGGEGRSRLAPTSATSPRGNEITDALTDLRLALSPRAVAGLVLFFDDLP